MLKKDFLKKLNALCLIAASVSIGFAPGYAQSGSSVPQPTDASLQTAPMGRPASETINIGNSSMSGSMNGGMTGTTNSTTAPVPGTSAPMNSQTGISPNQSVLPGQPGMNGNSSTMSSGMGGSTNAYTTGTPSSAATPMSSIDPMGTNGASTTVAAYNLMMMSQTPAQLNDGEILAALMALNSNEIVASEMVLKKDVDPSVKKFALKMRQHHVANAALANEMGGKYGIMPIVTPLVQELRSKGVSQLSTMATMDNQQLGQSYMSVMTSDHQQALSLIDNQLLPNVQNTALRKHLLLTRNVVDVHLQKSQHLEDKHSES